MIPIFIGLSLLFFLFFMLTARGQSVRLYQQNIFQWNKAKIGMAMSSIGLQYKILPYSNSSISKIAGY
jgi:hypothetical protein